jgi:hypothetical protein
MGTYTSSRCGHCGSTWQFMESGRNSKFGSPIVKCVTCKGLNKTNSKLYRDMNLFSRVLFWFRQAVTWGLINGLLPLVGGVYGLVKALEAESALGGIFATLFILFGSYNLYGLTKLMDKIKETEDLFDKNGGFLWSNEQHEFMY